MPSKWPKQLVVWSPEADAWLAAARAAMPGGQDASASEVVRWALRVAPLASQKARELAAKRG